MDGLVKAKNNNIMQIMWKNFKQKIDFQFKDTFMQLPVDICMYGNQSLIIQLKPRKN